MAIRWTKVGDALTAKAGPFDMKVEQKGDGRWTWSISREGKSAEASGVAKAVGQAKNAAENFVNRSGLVG